jgi:hypothetical protein
VSKVGLRGGHLGRLAEHEKQDQEARRPSLSAMPFVLILRHFAQGSLEMSFVVRSLPSNGGRIGFWKADQILGGRRSANQILEWSQ